jgi:GDP/UDP-N,N'-diacetylbacillosamine 2-epimerase (hydrolysing)
VNVRVLADVRRIVSITGSRADYGLMEPVHRAISASESLELHLIVTGMHLLPDFSSSLAQVRADRLGELHEVNMVLGKDSGRAMAQSVGHGLVGIAALLDELKPDIMLLQGDRGEMLAGAIAAAHMNIAIVHMSGGDFSGSIDDSVRNAISKFAHFHLTNCAASTRRLIAMAESPARIVEVGDPALDQVRTTDFLPLNQLASELALPPGQPFLIATLHPVTDEADQSASQMTTLLEALAELGMTTIFTYPNSDHGGRAMRDVLESWRGQSFLRIEPNLGSRRYLSLLRHAGAMVGNSSSGFFEAPSFKIPVVNIGTRQQNRLRASNIVDAECNRADILRALRYALTDGAFRSALASCKSPYGDGRTAERAVDILRRLQLGPALITKWQPHAGPFVAVSRDGL